MEITVHCGSALVPSVIDPERTPESRSELDVVTWD
jgi:hypothetical protein